MPAKHFGVRPDHRRRGDPRRAVRARHAPSSRRLRATRTCVGYSPPRTAHTRATRRNREPLPRRSTRSLLEELHDGLVWPLRMRPATGSVCTTRNAAARPRRRVRPRQNFFVELQRARTNAADARRNSALRDLAESPRRCVRLVTGDVHAHDPRARAALQERGSSLVRCRHLARRLRARAPRQPRNASSLRRPDMLERFPRRPTIAVERTSELAERLEFDLTPGARLSLSRTSSDGADPAIAQLTRICNDAFRRAVRPPTAVGASPGLDDELAPHRRASGLAGFFLLHWEVVAARARCRASRCAGPGSMRHLPAARPRTAAPPVGLARFVT